MDGRLVTAMTIRAGKGQAPFVFRASVPASEDHAAAFAGMTQADDPYTPVVHAPPDQPFVVAQLGQSLDGRIATISGESRYINGSGALDHLHRLRALCDAVVTGAGTVIADDPMLTVRRVEGRNPARVVIDPSGRVPPVARCMAPDGTRRIVVTAGKAVFPAGVEVITLPRRNEKIGCKEIISELFDRGLRRLLIEGGAATVSGFIHADAVDRLHILFAPVILGSGKIGIELPAITGLSEARRLGVQVYHLAGSDVLFDCHMRNAKN
jgi:riboflavin-specific deaminase-like protein